MNSEPEKYLRVGLHLYGKSIRLDECKQELHPHLLSTCVFSLPLPSILGQEFCECYTRKP